MTARRVSNALLIPLLPTVDAHATSKKYVDDAIAGVVTGTVTMASIDGLIPALDGKIDKSVIDAKGDLVIGTAANTPGILPVSGTNGRVLTEDSSTGTGLLWHSLVKADVGLGSVDNLQQQPLSTDLTAIAAIAPTNDDVIQRKAGAWTNRTMAQLKTDLALNNVTNNAQYYAGGTDVAITDGGTGASTLPTGLLKGAGTGAITAASAGTDYVAPGGALGTPSSGTLTNATGLPISGLVASTSTAIGVGTVELGHATDTTLSRSAAGKLAVEGIDVVLLSGAQTLTGKTLTSPVINTPTGIVKGDVGLGNVDNTSNATERAAVAALTNKDLTSGTNSFPTLNQDTTGSAAKWTTARNLAGNSVDGSAAVNFANKFVVQGTADAGLTAAQFLGALSTGLVKNTTTTGVLSIGAQGTDYYAPAGTDVAITDGGTGVSTLPSGLLKGAGTGAITAGAAGTDYVAPGGALGTPSSGTLTNVTGLPVAGIVSSTVTALGVGTVELGHATDTTLSRSAAGVLAVEGVDVLTTSGTQTQTNKTVSDTFMGEAFDAQKTQRDTTLLASNDFTVIDVLEIASSYSLEIPATSTLEVFTSGLKRGWGRSVVPGATITVNTDAFDTYLITSMGAALTITLSGTGRNRILVGFRDDGTARAITWANAQSSGAGTLPTTTVISKTHWVGLIHDGTTWTCLAADAIGY